MLPLQKKIVTDESMRPVAVMIDYEDWERIEKILEAYQQEDDIDDISEFEGIIQLSEDPLEYQRRIRNEWE